MTYKNPYSGIKTKSVRRVSETNQGIYYWKLPSGKPLMDDDYNVLSIASERGDIRKMALLSAEAKSLGFPDGTPVFQEGVYKITDEEWAEQVDAFLGQGQ